MSDIHGPPEDDLDISQMPSGYSSEDDGIEHLPIEAMPGEENRPRNPVAEVVPGSLTGVAKGAMALPGAVGSAGQFWDEAHTWPAQGALWAGEKLGALKPEQRKSLQGVIEKDLQGDSPAEKKGYVNRIFGLPFPTGSASYDVAKSIIGEPKWKPTTGVGRVSEGLGTALTASPLTPGKYKVFNTMAAAIPSELAGETTRGSSYERAARIFGSFVGAPFSALREARSPEAAAKRAQDVASRALRERYADPDSTYDVLRRHAETPPRLLDGVEPTSAQVEAMGRADSGAAAHDIQNDVRGGYGSGRGSPPQLTTQLTNNDAIVREAAGDAADHVSRNAPDVRVQDHYGFNGPTPRLTASQAAHESVSGVASQMKSSADTAWQALTDEGTVLHRDAVTNALDNIMSKLDPVDKTTLPTFIRDAVNGLKQGPWGVSIDTVQNLRSMIGKAGKAAGTSDRPVNSTALKKISDELEDVLTNKNSYAFGSDKGPQLWDSARTATKNYKSVFGEGIAADIADGSISPEGAMQKVLSGPNAARNLREIKSVPGVSGIDEAVADHMIGQLTHDGTRVVKPAQVAQFAADNAAILRETPGLADRLNSIAQRAGESELNATRRQLSENMRNAMQTPDKLVKFLDNHGDDVKSALPPGVDPTFIDDLHRSARLISRLPKAQSISRETTDQLLNDNMFTLFYGKAVGRLADSAAAEGTVRMFTGIPGLGALAGMSGAARHLNSTILDPLTRFVFGGTKEEALKILDRAAYDPQFKALLMKPPTAQNAKAVMDVIGGKTAGALAPFGNSLRNPLMRTGAIIESKDATNDDRQKRATGGRVVDHKAEANKLIMRVAYGLHKQNKKTEGLLDLHDDAVTKALKTADSYI